MALTKTQLEEFTKEVLKITQKDWWERENSWNPIEDIKAMEKLMKDKDFYIPFDGKVKISKELYNLLFLTAKSED